MTRSVLFITLGIIMLASSCSGNKDIPIAAYYDYDSKLPLLDTILSEADSGNYSLIKVSFNSVQDKTVFGL